MATRQLNRRDWLKTSMLTAGGILSTPYLGFAENWKAPLQLDAQGNAMYSPFFKEYLLDDLREFPVLSAKLNANENPYGPSPKALEAFTTAAPKGNRYAWKELFQLVSKIAEFEGVQDQNLSLIHI